MSETVEGLPPVAEAGDTAPVPLAVPRTRRALRDQDRHGRSAGLDRRGLFAAAAGGLTLSAAAGKMLLSGHSEAGAGPGTAARGGSSAAATGTATPGPVTTTGPAGFTLAANLDPDLLISRATYGRTATLERQVHEASPTRWLMGQLAPGAIKDPAGSAVVGLFPRLSWSTSKVRSSLSDGNWEVMQDLTAAHLGRACWSSRQLFEVMVDFWSNHLNVTVPSDGVWDSRHRYDADVIRANALGSFEKMLLASAFHPSMLIYLNNAESTRDAPNENYARELLELHTVGVDGGYTERDVQRGALLLTGWKVENGRASYDRSRHHSGRLTVFGFSAGSSTGPEAQRRYLSYLARHPRTAQNISLKLAQHFVSDDPPPALVARMATAYRKSRTAIVPVLRTMFAAPEFAASAGEKVRRPMDVIAAAVRVLDIKPGSQGKGLIDLVWMLGGMGHAPLGWPQPDGYALTADAWQSPSSALAQFNALTSLVHGWWPDKLANPTAAKLLSTQPRSRTAVIDAVARKLLGRAPTASEKQAAQTLLAGTSLPKSFSPGTYQQQESIALVATLLLQSPAHLIR